MKTTDNGDGTYTHTYIEKNREALRNEEETMLQFIKASTDKPIDWNAVSLWLTMRLARIEADLDGKPNAR